MTNKHGIAILPDAKPQPKLSPTFLIGPNLTVGDLEAKLHRRIRGPNRRSRKRMQPTLRGGAAASEFEVVVLVCGSACLWCGSTRNITADHVVPTSRGGANDRTNLQPLCSICNSCKGQRILDFRRICDIAELERQVLEEGL